MFERELQQFGLTDGEAKVYEALIVIGASKVGPIVKKSGIAYSNIYEVLQRLTEKGLVSFITREKTKIFQAVEPSRLQEFLDKKEEEIERSKKALTNILPSLENIKALTGSKLDAEVFVGMKGITTAYKILLKDAKKEDIDLYFYMSSPKYIEPATIFYGKTWTWMSKIEIKALGIANREHKGAEMTKNYPSWVDERYVNYPVPGNIDILNDKVLIISWSDKPIGILIQSKDVADNFRNYFYATWKIAKP
ncbi:hypothetical protein COV18_03885 [Candidatus Woesearchaeota archaeon CG10_big_fil_rev_8_21_14_0_10_37_12]|nr:MAG: hypothetical protein COV18_03885 [Candidatus Woesearchaeota archaeon CG10_big_fil_rev_8_21_14_0_10_37_12]